MADSKLADLTATTALDDNDLLYVVRDPAGTPVDRKITVASARTAISSVVAYSWRMNDAGERAQWTDVGSGGRVTYGSGTDGYGRTALTATLTQGAGPPGNWAAASAIFDVAQWNGPGVAVAAGDIVQFSFVAGWTRSANSLSETDSAPFGNPGYSVAADRNAELVRFSADLATDDSFFSYYNTAVMEPQVAWYAGGWVFNFGYYHPLPPVTVVAMEDCTVSPLVTIGPFWGNVAGVAEFVSATMTVSSPA